MPYPWRSFREWVFEEEKLGNVVRAKKPMKAGDYNNLVDIGNGIPGKIPETDLRAFSRYLHTLPGMPIGIVEKPINNRPDIPIVINPWPNRERMLRSAGCENNKEKLAEKFSNFKDPSKKIKSEIVSKGKAPCKEVIIREPDIDLTTCIPRCWVEFNQLCWSPCNDVYAVYDPETKTHNLGCWRTGVCDWENADPTKPMSEERRKKYMYTTLIYMGTTRSDGGAFFQDRYRSKGKSMPCAFSFGLPGDFHIVAASTTSAMHWPEDGDEYEALGGFRGEPIELVESETIPDLMVPAHAEWVVEGEFEPEDFLVPEYGEDIASGYMFGGDSCPFFRVKCITHRKDPWWTFTWSDQGRSHEGPHTGLFRPYEVEVLNHIRRAGYEVKDVGMTTEMATMIVQLPFDGADKPWPNYGKVVGMSAYSNRTKHLGYQTKYVIVVGPDINIDDFKDVFWALNNRVMPVSDSIMIEKGNCEWGDPGGFPGPLGWKTYGEQMIIDATIKVPERYDSYPPVCCPREWEDNAIERMKKELEGK